ncbi:MAG: hypothetical protein HON53_08665 [Planctomycetaceae bacterium]|jgi:hypothetical protein|nr:hypothetical protein [Planctomycetaceae bacterium]MBT6153929.1 hypothetical protein [Planctomycetaceae bacterium]MBT6483769.1 hypothetical protein [Planctomycetaceae bacterium]MBT6494535.1 hypothetical protein [Planctomycetaceae bacterium]
MDIVAILSRWAHVGAAVVLVGGTVFMRFALMPAAKELPEDVHNSLRERVMGNWRKIVGIAILLLLLSGIANFFFVLKDKPRLEEHKSLYHSLIGIKIILAMVVFFLASALSGRAKGLEGLRKKSGFWMGLNLTLAAIIIAIAGYLKVAV